MAFSEFVGTVMASVIAYIVCKWLDSILQPLTSPTKMKRRELSEVAHVFSFGFQCIRILLPVLTITFSVRQYKQDFSPAITCSSNARCRGS